jgi:hypothetical protein
VLEDVFVSGATANCVDIENRDVAEGRFIAEPENENAARVAYVGADIATKLFPVGNAVGSEITVRGLPYRVIGVETARGTVFGIPQDTFIILPLKTYAVNYGGLIRQRSVYFIATSKTDELFNDAVEESRFLMRVRRKLGPGEKTTSASSRPTRSQACAIDCLGRSLSSPSPSRESRWSLARS